MPRARRTAWGAWAVALCAALGWGHAAGDASLQFTLAELDGEGWRAAGISISLQRDGGNGRLAATFNAARLVLPAPVGLLENFSAECRGLAVTSRRFACEELVLAPGMPGPAIPRMAGPAEYRRDSGEVSWRLGARGPEAATLTFGGAFAAGRWVVQLGASRWPAEELAALAGMFAHGLPEIVGLADFSITARGAGDAFLGLVFKVGGIDVALANEAGTMAAESLGFELEGSAWPEGERFAFSVRGAVASGEMYMEPVYANLAQHPLRVAAHGGVATGRLELDSLVLDQAGVAHADIRAEFVSNGDEWQIRSGRFRLAEATLPGAYAILLQPFLAGTPFDDLDTIGQLRGELRIADYRLEEFSLDLAGVQLDDRSARLGIYDLWGELAWRAPSDGVPAGPLRATRLDWSGGFVYGIPFGAARIRLDPIDGRWSLPSPLSIPVLDGALEIQALEIGDFLSGDETLSFDARLAPVSMRELSRALDWPPLSGQVSGVLPSLSYADGILAIAGEFTAEVFGGAVAIRDLRIERPLQPLARLRAEIELRGLELAEVTEALAFGLMTGRVDGDVRGLEMIDWAPVAFDGRLQTPRDGSRRRISQRAVDNIASLGGGGAGILSSGFLRFFSDFSYDAFALGCRLERDICEMSGLEPRDEGYVILRGRGLPRIDVMGFSQRVSWSALVAQLAGIMAAEGVEVR
jgi:hypothetical protein